MYPPPNGPELTPDECRALDDTYFSSDPTSYFRSKVDSLLDWIDQPVASTAAPSDYRRRFMEILGPAAESRYPTSEEQRKRQVAIDAIQLRHHTAEALLRLIHARLACRANTETTSLWMALIRTPTTLHTLVQDLMVSFKEPDFFPVLAGLMIPLPYGSKLDRDSIEAVLNARHWIARAIHLVSSGQLDLNAANNKIKHGITARPEDKMRVTLMTQPPNDDGSVRLSALTGDTSFELIDTIALEYISRPPKAPGSEPLGYERTLLRADAPAVLAEAWILALIHGAIFHTAAYRHHGDETPPDVAQHPGLPLAPRPEQVRGHHVVGLRFPVTTSASGQVHRPAGMLLTDGTFQSLAMGPRTRAVIVEG